MMISACGASHRGNVRKNNEDNIYVDGLFRHDLSRDNVLFRSRRETSPHVFAVFDGLGGEACGEHASLVASLGLRAMEDRNVAGDIKTYIRTTHKTIIRESVYMDAINMGTTGAGAVISGDQATIWNVGDSRVYLFRNGQLTRLSRDDSVVQMLVDRGIIREEERTTSIYAGELIQYLGMEPDDGTEPCAHISTEKLVPGDILLLCSDGLSGELGDEVLRDMIDDSKDRTAEFIVTTLLKKAVDGKCRDNVSAIICRIEEDK